MRPIYHRLESRVRAHIFLCMLAYYVQWHMLEAWRPLLFCDEDQPAKATRDPVAPAERSESARRKAHTHTLEDGAQVHSFSTLLKRLSAIVRNTCRIPGERSPGTSLTSSPPPTLSNNAPTSCYRKSQCRQSRTAHIRLSPLNKQKNSTATSRNFSLNVIHLLPDREAVLTGI